MKSAELVAAMQAHTPVIYDHPLHGVQRYERIVGVGYKMTEDCRHPMNSHDGVTIGVTLLDYNHRSLMNADPQYVHRYTREEYERRVKEWKGD